MTAHTIGRVLPDDVSVSGSGIGDRWALRAGIAGGSEVRLTLASGASSAIDVVLVIDVLAGMRGLLPNSGVARLDVDVDGFALAREVSVFGGQRGSIVLPLQLRSLGERGTHEIRVRLDRTSNTTLRLERVVVKRP